MPMNDNSKMPFGKHRGTRMKDLDASYLDWLNEQDWLEKFNKDVFDYIQDNMDAINKELPEHDNN